MSGNMPGIAGLFVRIVCQYMCPPFFQIPLRVEITRRYSK